MMNIHILDQTTVSCAQFKEQPLVMTLVDGPVSHFCSDNPLPKLLCVLQCRWDGLVRAGKKILQLIGYLALQCQERGRLPSPPQPSSAA